MARHIPAPSPAALPDMRVRHVIFINDDRVTREVIETVSRRSDRLVVSAVASGRDALAIAEKIRVDLLLSDVQRPDEDVWAFLEWFHGVYPDVPLGIVSACFGGEKTAAPSWELLEVQRDAQRLGAVLALAPGDLTSPEIEHKLLQACDR